MDTQSQIEYIRDHLDRSIVVIGLMGVGKTRLGKALSSALSIPFQDSDDEIEAAAGMSIPEIFEKFGEPYFRDGEHRVIRRLLDDENAQVIATGGGAIMTAATADLVWEQAISIWIKAELSTMVKRTSKNDNRPLLKGGNSEDILKNLSDLRYPTYAKANIMVESDKGSFDEIVNNMISQIYEYLQ